MIGRFPGALATLALATGLLLALRAMAEPPAPEDSTLSPIEVRVVDGPGPDDVTQETT
jgi:hypothetical protein